jgi:hypothetical protein
MEDAEVETLLFRSLGRREPPARAPIDMTWVHRELQRSGVTLMLLWSEYAEAVRCGLAVGAVPYGYSRFCELYSRYQGNVDVTMRQVHLAGEKVFIDYSGKQPCIHDLLTGQRPINDEVALIEMHLLGSNALSCHEIVDLFDAEALVENQYVRNDLARMHEVNTREEHAIRIEQMLDGRIRFEQPFSSPTREALVVPDRGPFVTHPLPSSMSSS